VLAALTRLQKDVEQKMETISSDRALDGPWAKKLSATSAAVEDTRSKIDKIKRTFERCQKEAYELSDAHVRGLKLELDTGGNTRLEDGKLSDVW
jgi:hypothetical protein